MSDGGGDRYLKEEDEDDEFVPEGVEAATPYKGSVQSELHHSSAACSLAWATSAQRPSRSSRNVRSSSASPRPASRRATPRRDDHR